MQTIESIREIIANISFRGEWFQVMSKGDGFLIQLHYWEPDVDTGKREEQKARKWFISQHSTESEIVQTALLACLTSAEHRVREHFKYKGKRLFGPHIDVNKHMEISEDTSHRD